MRGTIRSGLAVISVVAATLTVGAVLPTSVAHASTVAQDRIPSQVPATWTPRINDGSVQSIVQVGDQMVVGGDFTSVSASSGSPTYSRSRIVAFNATTGSINTGFNPTLNGTVNKVLAGPVAGTVLVGGTFTQVNGTTRRNLALINLSNGSLNNTFVPPVFNGQVRDLVRVGNRLMVAGLFTTMGGVAHAGIGSGNWNTGALDPFVNIQLSENHNWYEGCSNCAKAGVGASYIDASPDGSTLIAIGNFKRANGLLRDQIVNIDLSGGSAVVRPDWNTSRYSPACAFRAFDTYMRGLDFAPDGSYFVVATTGAPNTNTLCDSVSRFETADRGTAIEPTWSSFSGGDTFLSVLSTMSGVYAGGHQRWMNNDSGRDSAQAGSVPRPGLGAMDPASGVPLSWNPGRNPRGVGAAALHATAAGLWVGSDTEWIGSYTYRRPRIAFFPLQGGTTPPAGQAMSLPSDVYLGGAITGTDGSISRRTFDGTTASATQPAPTGGMNWANVRGAVQIDDMLYYGSTDGTLHRRTFDGTSYGPDTSLDPYHDAYWCPITTGSGTTVYCGVNPSLYGSTMSNVAAMAYSNGRLYYTLTNSSGLFYRLFSPESGIVNTVQRQVNGNLGTGSPAILISGNNLYFASRTNGNLSRISFGPNGTSGSATVVSGPGLDGNDWRARAVFMAPGPGTPPANEDPTASFTVSCPTMTCTFNGSASDDPDGSIASYVWNFGDGTTSVPGTGHPGAVNHTFTNPGSYTVTLTVTDNQGATGTAQATAAPNAPAAPVAAFTSGCNQLVCSFNGGGSTTGAPPLTYSWNWGDGTAAGSGVSPSHPYASAGGYNVTLTVTDAQNRTDSISQQVTVSSGQPSGNISFVDSAGMNANTQNPTVIVPDGTQPGDGMVMIVSWNTTATSVSSPPAGWTLVDDASSNGMVSQVYRRTAGAGDAGSNVTVGFNRYAKATVNLGVYRGTATGSFVAAAVTTATGGTARVAPAINVTTDGSWVVSHWADKSSGTTTSWTAPGSVTTRRSSFGSGGGAVSSLLADSGGPVNAGNYPARTATTNASGTNAIAWTLALAPAA